MSASSPELLNPATAIMSSTPLTLTTALAGLAVICLAAIALYPSSLLRWFQRKRYQYEVTFSLYMLTPTEKFVFNSILFLLLSMVSIAIALYLPRHVSVIAHRAYYYLSGELGTNASRVSDSLPKTAAAITSHVPTAVSHAAETVSNSAPQL